MMLSYAEIKCALKAKHESTTHFTEKFFNAYIAAQADNFRRVNAATRKRVKVASP